MVNVERFAYMNDMTKKSEARVKLVVGPLDAGRPGRARYRTVERDGKRVRLRIVDVDGPRFAADFQASFTASVKRARKENRALDGD